MTSTTNPYTERESNSRSSQVSKSISRLADVHHLPRSRAFFNLQLNRVGMEGKAFAFGLSYRHRDYKTRKSKTNREKEKNGKTGGGHGVGQFHDSFFFILWLSRVLSPLANEKTKIRIHRFTSVEPRVEGWRCQVSKDRTTLSALGFLLGGRPNQ